jgi:hypothetical protein
MTDGRLKYSSHAELVSASALKKATNPETSLG